MPHLLAGIIIPELVAFSFVLGRIVSHVTLLKMWGWDDTRIMIAWFNAFAVLVLFGVGTEYGHGHHIEDIPLNVLPGSYAVLHGALLCYQLALLFTKLSILVFYLRVFPGHRERWMYVCNPNPRGLRMTQITYWDLYAVLLHNTS